MSGSLEPMSSGSDGEISHEKISHSGDSLVAPTVSDQLGEISAESPSLRTGSSNVLPNISSTTASSLENSLNESRDISPKREDEETTTVEEATRSAIREQASTPA